MPNQFFSYARQLSADLFPGPPGGPSGADRAAVFFCSRPGADDSLPFVAVGAEPPDPPGRAAGYLARFQLPLFGTMPLGDQLAAVIPGAISS